MTVTTLFEMLVQTFAGDLAHARRIADRHTLDIEGRCTACHSDGPSSARPFGCTVGAAARKALHDRKP